MNTEIFKNKTIGIIGLGYIGKNLYEYLQKNTFELNTKIVTFDKKNFRSVIDFEFDYFFNTAGNSGDFRENIFETVESNIDLTVFLLKNIKLKNKYIALSSTRLYGFSESENVFFEEDFYSTNQHLNIDFIYDGTKKLAESILLNSAEKLNYEIVIVRLSNVYGMFDELNDSTLIKKIIRLKSENSELKIRKSVADSKKDYIYIDDAIEGIIQCAMFGENKEIFNIAYGKSFSIKEISDILKLKLAFENDNSKPVFSNISIKKSISKIQFKPKIDLKTGLLKTLNIETK
jgi:nucleoside-diphosphate-sugar epimerase